MPLPQADPDIFETQSGGGCAALFGLPFLLVGLGSLGASAFGAAGADLPPLAFGLLFGTVFTVVGGALVFGRAGLRIDRRKGEIEKWFGLLRPMRRKVHPLGPANAVALFREVRRSNKSSHTVYPVRILMGQGKPIDISAGQSRPKARRQAESLAKFLRLPLDDFSDGEPTRREHEELDQSLRERFREGRLATEVPEVPAYLRSRIQFYDTRLEVDIPPTGFQALPALVALAAATFGIVPAMMIVGMASGQGGERYFLYAFAALFAAIPFSVAYAMLSSMFFASERIMATPDGLSHVRGWLMRRQSFLPANKIEEIRLSAPGIARAGRGRYGSGRRASITLETDEKTVRIGSHLGSAEAAYLLALIRAVLAA